MAAPYGGTPELNAQHAGQQSNFLPPAAASPQPAQPSTLSSKASQSHLPPSYPGAPPNYGPPPQGMTAPVVSQTTSPAYLTPGLPPAIATAGVTTQTYTQTYPPQQPAGTVPGQPMMYAPHPQAGVPQQVPFVIVANQTAPTTHMTDLRAEALARCAQGLHGYRRKQYGVFGIIMAIVFFPIGLLCLFADVEEECTICGQRFN